MKKGIVNQIAKKAAYKVAETSANRICCYFFHQPKLPRAVQKLRKF
ncbi:MAG: cyclic lactone autoinducer peptide [Lachnospiraceae bacterium]|nr:cyclic lactone autoinducer peptide [Lachnospiraceae bacterium]